MLKKTIFLFLIVSLFIGISLNRRAFADDTIKFWLTDEVNFIYYPNGGIRAEGYIYFHWTPVAGANYYKFIRNGVDFGLSTAAGVCLWNTYYSPVYDPVYGEFNFWKGWENAKNDYYGASWKVRAVLANGQYIDSAIILPSSNPAGNITNQPVLNNRTSVAEPINVANGQMFTSKVDIFVPGREISLGLTRYYNNQDYYDGSFGRNWRSNFDISLSVQADNSIVESDENAVYTIYALNADNTYTPSPGKYSILAKNPNGTYLLSRRNGRKLYFDTRGRLNKIEERNGNCLTILRAHNGVIAEVSDSSGRKLLFTQNTHGKITQVTDPAGRIFNYEYDASGNLTKVTDPLNNVTIYQYDFYHNLTQLTDANNHLLNFEYDALNRAYHSWQDGNNNAVTLSFDADNKTTTVTDSRNNLTKYEYNDYGLVTKVTDALNYSQITAWDANMNKISSLDRNANTTGYSYDARGNLLTITDPLNNITTFTYEPNFDFVKTLTDAKGSVITYDYDIKGNLAKFTDCFGNFTLNAYDNLGQLLNTTNPKSATTTFVYDNYGNLAISTDALGNVTLFSYDISGNRTQAKDARNNITQFIYNNLNQLTQIIYPDASTLTYTYDALGNKLSATDNASNTTQYSYDLNNKVTSITNPLGKVILFSYDTEGNLLKVTDQNQHETTYVYDSLNRRIAETNPLGLTKTYAYDPEGNKTGLTDAKNNTIIYEYDALKRLTKINYPDLSSASFAYDSLGRRITMTDAQGVTNYTYDLLGRLTQTTGPGQNSTLQYSYDVLGKRTSLILPGNKIIQYGYDVLGRLISITDSNNKATTYTYDEVGNPASITYPNNVQTNYTFDSVGRLTHLLNQGQSKLSEFNYTYDPVGRRSSVALLDGAITYTYDALGELTSEINNSTGNPYQITYEYDPSGNRTRMLKNNLEHLYTYNQANQLTQEQLNGPATTSIEVIGSITDANSIKSFTINGSAVTLDGNNFNSQIVLSSGQNPIILTATDAAGNTATKTIQVTYNSNQQILYAYDNNGNLISKQSSNQTLNLGYDYENRLSSVITSPAQQGEASYTYNGEGKRISSTNGSTTTNYLYDSLDVVLELNGSNDPVAAYLRNPYAAGGIGGIISSQQGTNPEVYYSYDGLGSVVNLSDTTGANIQSYSYDAFGNIIAETGSTTNSNKFLTKEMDLSGFIYFGARYYDPKIGRFITQDPLGMVDGTNVYLYCSNDPINLVDPYGEAYFAEKPLADGLWIPIASNNFIDDYFNTEVSHEQIFFEDEKGGNIGFNKDDRYGSRALFGFAQGVLWEDVSPKGYRKTKTGYDDELLRKAVGSMDLRPYQLLWFGKGKKFNCQDWAEGVRQAYVQLKKEQKNKKCK